MIIENNLQEVEKNPTSSLDEVNPRNIVLNDVYIFVSSIYMPIMHTEYKYLFISIFDSLNETSFLL